MIEIFCENNKSKNNYKIGTSLAEIAKKENLNLKYPVIGAFVNNKIKDLSYQIYKPKTIKFLDITHSTGIRIYKRSLSFVLYKAVRDLYPNNKLKIEHSVSKGLYCELEGFGSDTEQHLQAIINIGERMRKIIKQDIPFIREEILTKDAIELFEKNNLTEKAHLLKTRALLYTSLYKLDDCIDYFYGCLVPSTGYLKNFDLEKYYEGMLLIYPKRSNPEVLEDIVNQDKMFDIFREYKNWGEIINIPNIASLNQAVQECCIGDIIKIAEALHEKKLAQIADSIFKQRDKVKLILISGPSSSGKTTFAKRLAIQLRVSGLKPIQISLDNYFVNRDKTPIDANGDFNFESIDALDVKLVNENLIDLFDKKEVCLPKFSFTSGSRFYENTKLKINDENIIIIEGIHALNPNLTPKIKNENKLKIYVSALTQLGIDSHNRIPTTDNRLIRRIVRDYRYRHYSALDTLKRWESVRQGEEENIFPYQEEADVMFNSALLFELGVLKQYAEPLLKKVQENNTEYAEALRLLKFLSYFLPIPDDEIPPTSILREFLGGSSFDYK